MYSMFALDDILITNIILNKNRATLKHICIYQFNTFCSQLQCLFITIIINMVSHLIFTISNVMFFYFQINIKWTDAYF